MRAISGTIWIADAPVPTTATRLPARSTSWFQRAEWKISPWNVPMPSRSGSLGSISAPAPAIRVRAVTRPAPVVTSHRPVSSSQRASSTAVSNRKRSSTPDSRATRRRYARISGCGENDIDQSGFGANENE